MSEASVVSAAYTRILLLTYCSPLQSSGCLTSCRYLRSDLRWNRCESLPSLLRPVPAHSDRAPCRRITLLTVKFIPFFLITWYVVVNVVPTSFRGEERRRAGMLEKVLPCRTTAAGHTDVRSAWQDHSQHYLVFLPCNLR